MRTGWTWWAGESAGQCGEVGSRREAQRRLAAAIGRRTLRGLPTANGPERGETYYYSTRRERNADETGAHAWAVYPSTR